MQLHRLQHLVSIPERVWGGLELVPGIAFNCCILVSIPERVWGGLEPVLKRRDRNVDVFQSLRGFGVGWSHRGEAWQGQTRCFNP